MKHVTQWIPLSLLSRSLNIAMGLSRNELWRILLSNELNPCFTHGRSTWFLTMLYQQKHCQFGFKRTERVLNERPSDPQNNANKKRADKATQLQIQINLHQKDSELLTKCWAEEVEPRATNNYYQILKPNGVCLDGFQNC